MCNEETLSKNRSWGISRRPHCTPVCYDAKFANYSFQFEQPGS